MYKVNLSSSTKGKPPLPSPPKKRSQITSSSSSRVFDGHRLRVDPDTDFQEVFKLLADRLEPFLHLLGVLAPDDDPSRGVIEAGDGCDYVDCFREDGL